MTDREARLLRYGGGSEESSMGDLREDAPALNQLAQALGPLAPGTYIIVWNPAMLTFETINYLGKWLDARGIQTCWLLTSDIHNAVKILQVEKPESVAP